jgi:hypothetical protein
MLERVARWTLTFHWRPPAGLISKAPFRGARAAATAMGENMRLMSHAYRTTQDPVFLAVPFRSLMESFVSKPQSIQTRSTGRIYNYVPSFLYTLKEAGNPAFDSEIEVIGTAEEVKVARGGAATVTLRVRNHGRSPISGLRISFQPRLDLTTVAAGEPPLTVSPGGEAEFKYEVRAPELINLTCESNRIAYAHWSAVYQREGQTRMAHRWLRVVIGE